MNTTARCAAMALALAWLGGCDGKPATQRAALPAAAPVAAAAAPPAPAVAAVAKANGLRARATAPGTQPASAAAAVAKANAAAPAAAATGSRFAQRTGEIVNPDNATMVLLYFDLNGLKPPIDEWIERDMRVQTAAPADKAARRTAVRAEFEAAAAAVHGIGRLRLSIADARLSDYDPSYGEFTLGALSPASELHFNALGQKVVTRFANGDTVQAWQVPASEAQAMRDRIGRRPASLDAVLKIVDVLPGPGGGAIVTDIEQYTLRAADGSTLRRMP